MCIKSSCNQWSVKRELGITYRSTWIRHCVSVCQNLQQKEEIDYTLETLYNCVPMLNIDIQDIKRRKDMKFHSFLIKYGEIGIKGKNRYIFEDTALVRQIRFALKDVDGEFYVQKILWKNICGL